jgi:hypothetical protein
MLVLIVIAIACFIAGVVAAAQWLPDLAEGPVGTMAFFVICGLCGAVIGLFGLGIDSMIKQAESFGRGEFEQVAVADGLLNILRDCGSVAAFALIAFLLAPRPSDQPDRIAAPDATDSP